MRMFVACCSGAVLLVAGCAPSVPDRTRLVPVAAVVPVYPEPLRRAGVSGEASLDCAVTREGRVAGCSVRAQSDPRFTGAAMAAEAGARYLPETRHGAPVATPHHVVNFRFRIAVVTTATITCRITLAGAAEDCAPVDVHGKFAIVAHLVSLIEKMPHPPRYYRGRAVGDPARGFAAVESYQPIDFSGRPAIAPLPGYATHAEFMFACFPDLQQCMPIAQGDLGKYGDGSGGTLRRDLFAVAYGINEGPPTPEPN